MIVRSLFVSLGVAIQGATGLKTFDDALNKTKTDAEKADEAIRRLGSSGTALSKGFAAVLNSVGGKGALQVWASSLAEADKGFAHAAEHAAKFRDGVVGLGRDAAIAVAGVAGLALGIGAVTREAALDAQAIERQAKIFGMTTDAYQELRGVFADFNVDQRDVADLYAQIAQQADVAGQGGENIVRAFSQLGIKASELKGKSPEKLLERIADGMKATTNDAKRLAAASTLLGEDLTKKATPLLMKGAAGIATLRKSVHDLGGVRSAGALAEASLFARNLGSIQRAGRGVAMEFADGLIPTLNRGAEAFKGWIATNREWISLEIASVVDKLKRVVVFAEQAFVRFNKVVDALPGGKVTALRVLTGGVLGLAGALALYKVGGVAYEGLQTLYGLAEALAVLGGVATGPVFLGLIGVLEILGLTLASMAVVWGGLYLVIEDFVYFLQGKSSVFRDFRDWVETTGDFGKALAKHMDNMQRIFEDLSVLLPVLGDKLADLASRGFDALGKAAKDAYTYVAPLVNLIGGLLDKLALGLGAGGFSLTNLVADKLDAAALQAREAAYVPSGPMLPTPDVQGVMRQRGGVGGNVPAVGGDTVTIHVNGAQDTAATAAAVRAELESRDRAKRAQARGGPR